MTPSAEIEPGSLWWKASALTTRPTLPQRPTRNKCFCCGTIWSRKVKNGKHRQKLATKQCFATSWGFLYLVFRRPKAPSIYVQLFDNPKLPSSAALPLYFPFRKILFPLEYKLPVSQQWFEAISASKECRIVEMSRPESSLLWLHSLTLIIRQKNVKRYLTVRISRFVNCNSVHFTIESPWLKRW